MLKLSRHCQRDEGLTKARLVGEHGAAVSLEEKTNPRQRLALMRSEHDIAQADIAAHGLE
jgi:hypothetical protein